MAKRKPTAAKVKGERGSWPKQIAYGLAVVVVAAVVALYNAPQPQPEAPLPDPHTQATTPRREPPRKQKQNQAAKRPPLEKKVKTQDPGRVDFNENCATWAAAGECERNPGYMATECLKSCTKLEAPTTSAVKAQQDGVRSTKVEWPMPELPAALAEAQQQSDANPMVKPLRGCTDNRDDCASLAGTNLSVCGLAPLMLTECKRTCGTCGHEKLVEQVVGECRDSHEGCASWAASGECEKNRRFMLTGCSKACDVCNQKKFGCSRRNTVPGVVGPDGIGDMFRRALSDFPQYSPKALSTDPYVVQFEDLITSDEAADMIERCGDRLERSFAGDQLSPVRTSTQCWCDDSHDCITHPTVARITERMMNITQLPVNNAEYFQILRYEPGQFYKSHHDQQTAHWTPQGVRVYTFFIYLSDVEAGGGTKFNDLDLTVTPKLGRAILWPSTQEVDPIKGEMRTHHEALPVERGVKYAANLWMHLYDFKTPSRAGLCPFLGQNTNG